MNKIGITKLILIVLLLALTTGICLSSTAELVVASPITIAQAASNAKPLPIGDYEVVSEPRTEFINDAYGNRTVIDVERSGHVVAVYCLDPTAQVPPKGTDGYYDGSYWNFEDPYQDFSEWMILEQPEDTPTPTSTSTETATPTSTSTQTPTSTTTSTSTPTATSTFTSTPTQTPVPSTKTPTPTITVENPGGEVSAQQIINANTNIFADQTKAAQEAIVVAQQVAKAVNHAESSGQDSQNQAVAKSSLQKDDDNKVNHPTRGELGFAFIMLLGCVAFAWLRLKIWQEGKG